MLNIKCLEDVRFMQYIGAISATLGLTSGAMHLSWPSPTIPTLMGNTSFESPFDEPITEDESSWIVSCHLLSGIIAAPIVGYLVDKIGRKPTLQIGVLLLFVPWFITIFANKVWMLYISRTISGLGDITSIICCAIYNSEIADNDIRGKLGGIFTLMKLIGTFVVLGVGPFVSYTILGVISASIPALFLIIFFFMPESPYYLISKGRYEEAKVVLRRLAAKSTDDATIDKKLLNMQTSVEIGMANKPSVLGFFTSKDYRKILIIVAGVKTLQQMSGMAAIEAYMQHIVTKTDSIIPPEFSSLIFGAVQFPAAFVSAAVVDKLGRKPMLISSAIGCALALTSEGVYFLLQDYVKSGTSGLGWLPTTGIVVFLVCSAFGVYNLPYILLGELFETHIKGIAVGGATFYGATLAFVASKLFVPISNSFGTYTIFWIYAGFCVAGTIFVAIMLPETKGKSFDEIQEMINGPRAKPEMKMKDLEKF